MNILITGANGYIGRRLLIALVNQGHHVICCVRDKNRFEVTPSIRSKVSFIEIDFLNSDGFECTDKKIDVAYYLMHSMSTSKNYEQLELQVARNFCSAISPFEVEQVIYLSGITNDNILSKHLNSRLAVENELKKGDFNLTVLRAGIIIGSGSASFEIIRDLVEKLPVMLTPKWLLTKCQPIGVADVILFLSKSLLNRSTYNRNFDIGGKDILTYKQMLLEYAKVRGLVRSIVVVPVMTPKLSSYWLYFVTSTSYKLATALVSSMKVEVICTDNELASILSIETMSYKKALELAFQKIEQNQVVSSWKDSLVSGTFEENISDYLIVPKHGCFSDHRKKRITNRNTSLDRLWRIGGDNGWYYGNWLWKLRGFMDKLVGGVGLRRGRTNANKLFAGDAVDFWRVLYANKEEGRLLLFAEMKLPGEAWLEFRIENNDMVQIATFRPKGLIGRLYWYSVLPLHSFIFNGLINKILEE